MKVKVSELTGAALDWAVAKCEGVPYTYQHTAPGEYGRDSVTQRKRCYSTNWALGGPIIEQQQIATAYVGYERSEDQAWAAELDWYGPTPLVAAMRYYVEMTLCPEGDTDRAIEIPDELL